MNPVANIDTQAVNGLLGTNNPLAYKVHEIEKHLHNWERWFGLAHTPVAETHRADLVSIYTKTTAVIAPFTLDAGDNGWGSWVQILGSSDTPTNIGSGTLGVGVKFDLHAVAFTANEEASPYFVQFAFAETAAAALTAGTYTIRGFSFDAANFAMSDSVMMNRVAVGTKVWARALCHTKNTATVSFYYGIHEYIG